MLESRSDPSVVEDWRCQPSPQFFPELLPVERRVAPSPILCPQCLLGSVIPFPCPEELEVTRQASSEIIHQERQKTEENSEAESCGETVGLAERWD